ncbi:PadR family transcriptional regulator [ANME-1 cluster archaeon AG-394-G06]|nr:PadR family transcriptional regulator [ANME-1 cluster archaeon AG-394-G06]
MLYRLTISLNDTMMRNIFLGFIRIHILHHANEGEIFGVAIMDELRRHGYSISAGTLYPILHSLEAEGYLTRRNNVVNGKVRKYYRITEKGVNALEEAKPKIKELVAEVL